MLISIQLGLRLNKSLSTPFGRYIGLPIQAHFYLQICASQIFSCSTCVFAKFQRSSSHELSIAANCCVTQPFICFQINRRLVITPLFQRECCQCNGIQLWISFQCSVLARWSDAWTNIPGLWFQVPSAQFTICGVTKTFWSCAQAMMSVLNLNSGFVWLLERYMKSKNSHHVRAKPMFRFSQNKKFQHFNCKLCSS